jgi:hypothetical protein
LKEEGEEEGGGGVGGWVGGTKCVFAVAFRGRAVKEHGRFPFSLDVSRRLKFSEIVAGLAERGGYVLGESRAGKSVQARCIRPLQNHA